MPAEQLFRARGCANGGSIDDQEIRGCLID
jgi:hypothetical protein